MKERTNWPLIGVSYFTLFVLGLLDNARGPYFPDITADLRLSDTQASLFFAVASTVAYFSGRVVPELSRRMGLMNTVRLGQILMAIGFASISLAQGLTTLILTCALFGYGFGIINVAQNLLVIDGAQGKWRRQLFSGLHGMYAFSSLIAPLVIAQLFRMNHGWREVYLGFASVVSISFVSSFFAKTQHRQPAEQQLLRNPDRNAYWLVGSMLSLYIVAELLISTRLSLYVRRAHGFTPDEAASLLALFFLMLLVGRLVFLFIPFKATNVKIIELSLISSIFMLALGLSFHPLLIAFCGLTMAPVFAISLDLLTEQYPTFSADAIASCLALSCLYIVSMHFLMGLLTDWLGIRAAMFCGLVFLFSSWFLLRKMKARDGVVL